MMFDSQPSQGRSKETTLKAMALVCASLVLGCGGSNKQPTAPAPAPVESAAPEAPAAAPEPAAAEAPPAPPEPAPAEPAQPPPVIATANLQTFAGDNTSLGEVKFEVKDGKVEISGSFTGLPPGPHAVYIHEKGDCGKKGKAAGGHFNPTKSKHGAIGSPKRHAGDYGDVIADASGNASLTVTTDSITAEPAGSPTTVVGRAIMVYAKKDSPSGNAGAPLACGVITLPTESSASP
jgi:Cu-Zn family superoxide dismutase